MDRIAFSRVQRACQTTKAKVKEEDCGLFCSLGKQCSPESGPLMAAIELRLRGQDTNAKRWVPAPSTSTATPIMPKNMKKLKFLDIDATELARQLSLDSMARSALAPIRALVRQFYDEVRLFSYLYSRSRVRPGRVALLFG
jgi:hypothetical protein